jgi:hypothetical protein
VSSRAGREINRTGRGDGKRRYTLDIAQRDGTRRAGASLSASACPAALARVALLEVVVSNETNLLLKQLTRSKASLSRITSMTD